MPTNVTHISKLSITGRKQLLDGVIIPQKPADAVIHHDVTSTNPYGGIWYRTANTTPFLYLPPVCASDVLDLGITIPHYSYDVLIAVSTPGNAPIVLTGYFNYAIYQWAYYGILPQYYDDYTPFYWRFMPNLPQGWLDNAPAAYNADRSATD